MECLTFTTSDYRVVNFPKVYYSQNFRKQYVDGKILINVIDVIKNIYGIDEIMAKHKWRNLKKDHNLRSKFTFYHIFQYINNESNKKAPVDYADIETISKMIDYLFLHIRLLTYDEKVQKIDEFEVCSVTGYDRRTLISRYLDPILGNAKEVVFWQDILKPYISDKELLCECQYKVGSYIVDFYIPSLNLVIEYDEDGHKKYPVESEIERESFIKKSLECKLCRIDSRWKIGHMLTVLQNYIH